MSSYDEYIKNLLSEAEQPPPPEGQDAGGVPPAEGGDMGGDIGGGDMGGGMGGMGGGMGEPPPEQPVDDTEARKTARANDPVGYTKATLQALTDPSTGIGPEQFAAFLDSFSTGLAQINDKDGFKKYYNSLYVKIQNIIKAHDQLTKMFSKFSNVSNNIISTGSAEPDGAKGGKGVRSSASGPGVK